MLTLNSFLVVRLKPNKHIVIRHVNTILCLANVAPFSPIEPLNESFDADNSLAKGIAVHVGLKKVTCIMRLMCTL